MIKKLRLKLVAVSMLSLFVVLTAIMGVLNVLSYSSIVSDADNTLSMLADNRGSFPMNTDKPPYEDNKKPPKSEKKQGDGKKNSPELPYESRYFWVLLNDSGDVISTDTGKIAAIDTKTANAFAQEILSLGSSSGFKNEYRYIVSKESNQTRVIFLDCRRGLDSFWTTLWISVLVSIGGMLCVLALMLILSRRIIKPISDSYEKQKRFITDAGHELKTPLAIIEADVSVLEMDLEENEWLSDIRQQKDRLLSLTNDLIFLSKLEEEENKLSMADFSLSDALAECVHSFDTLAKANGKAIRTSISPMINYTGEEKSIRQLFNILTDNAIKHSSEKSDIEIILQTQGKNIILEVNNKADGLTAQDTKNMFERFYRADKSRSTETGGYGIGLSVAKAVVLAHKGKINAELKGDILCIKVWL